MDEQVLAPVVWCNETVAFSAIEPPAKVWTTLQRGSGEIWGRADLSKMRIV